ncbi:hypothetical protein ACFPT7_15945 [Acidicapsa dinghuensis]|uniref:Glycosyltransferase RgtA/B/C/D-like domain-containing protein n=1 Tax=Acidicapsa dinghuensis TaxID=2218256 RepID=A0ABW1EHN9_9BACT|nr:hypothetical protein [Acidicapsa dinghuensis]
MTIPPSSDSSSISLAFIDGALTAIGVGLCFAFPTIGAGFFSRVERAFTPIIRNKRLAVLFCGVATIVLRLAILPLCPIPLPFCTDDFSFLLSADTFLHGRLANPTPAMWVHFETPHVDMLPTYGSMYFPGYGLLLAAGKVLFGNPWFGVLLSGALMCSAICWMLQAWLPARWAFLGGAISVIHLALFTYWVNTYHAAATPGVIGGALILGALPRLKKRCQLRHGILMAVGISLLILTRPYEGMLLCVPVAVSLGIWIVKGKNRPAPSILMRRAIIPLAIIAITLGWLGYYDKAAFGKATTLPYAINRATYAIAPYFIWQHPRPEPAYRHPDLRRFYHRGELDYYYDVKREFVTQTLLKAGFVCFFFSGFALAPPLLMIRRVFMDRRVRFLVIGLVLFACGMVIQVYTITHYVAAFTASFYAIGLQAMRHLRQWRPEKKPVGLLITRLCVSICLVLTVVRVLAVPLGIPEPAWPVIKWNPMWYGPGHFGTERAAIADELENQPGKQLAIVYRGSRRNVLDEWVYNGADIDSQKVIWARAMSPGDNSELIRYYKDRRVWLVNADDLPATVTPYSDQTLLNLLQHPKTYPMPGQGSIEAEEFNHD